MKGLQCLILFGLIGFLAHSQESLVPKQRKIIDPTLQKKEIEFYLLVGQSNMAGNSPLEARDTVPNSNILRFNKDNQWEIAKEPLRIDKNIIGIGPGSTFGRVMAEKDTTVLIGLVPSAVGGTSIDLWVPGAFDSITDLHPFDQAIERTKIAMKTGILKGIIWHQGGSDSKDGKSKGYKNKLKKVIQTFRKKLEKPDLPFIVGLLPEYQVIKKIDNQRIVNEDAKNINESMIQLRRELTNYSVVSLKNPKDKGDGIHLDSKCARKFRKKYAHAMIELQK